MHQVADVGRAAVGAAALGGAEGDVGTAEEGLRRIALHREVHVVHVLHAAAVELRDHHADDVPGALEFFTRYKPFWGGANLVIRDRQKRSAAFEKCSYNFIEVFPAAPGAGNRYDITLSLTP